MLDTWRSSHNMKVTILFIYLFSVLLYCHFISIVSSLKPFKSLWFHLICVRNIFVHLEACVEWDYFFLYFCND